MDGIEAVLARAGERGSAATVVLENSVGGGGGLGTSLEELGAIADRLATRGIDEGAVAFCLDTAHAWGAGIDVGDPNTIDAFVDGFDSRIGLDRLVLVHLNDTRSAFGSRTDRHEHLGAGRIPAAGLAHVLRHPRLSGATYILETPGMDVGYDKVNMQRARALWAGKPLRPLPESGVSARRQRPWADGAGVIDRRVATVDRFVLPALLLLAAALRLPDLATRGTWDADQGHDMLVLRTLVRDGVMPLLGPPTSIGDVHHGAWYYYLLSPTAALTGGDSPLAVVAVIALAGIAAVGVVWWLARSVGGSLAGLVAGLVMATSAAAIDESTFIWNPNLIALSSATALAAAWRAWSGGDRRWWLVAAAGTAVTMQCHVLGVALLPIVGAPLVADARRRSLGRVPIGILAILAAAYAPLVINELTTDFSELRAATDYLAGGRSGAETAIPVRFGIVLLRVVSWPLTGLIIDGFAAAALATVVVIADRGMALASERRPGAVRGPLVRARSSVVDRLPDGRGAEPRLGGSRPAQRPLPRVRRSDGLRPRRPRGCRARSRDPGADRRRPGDGDRWSSRWSPGT